MAKIEHAGRSGGIPIFPGFKRVYDIATGEFIIKRQADGSCFTWYCISDEIISNGFGRLNLSKLDKKLFNDKEHFHEDVTPELSNIRAFIQKYGGVYKNTYPASKGEDGMPKFVPNADIWTNICFSGNTKTDAIREIQKYSMTLTDGVKLCLTYGEQYDYACQSIIDRGIKSLEEVVDNSSNWGNYSNNDGGKLLRTGANKNYMVAGFYGIAGGGFEITQEQYSDNCIAVRGGSFFDRGHCFPAFCRGRICIDYAFHSVGFGGTLYGNTEIPYKTINFNEVL